MGNGAGNGPVRVIIVDDDAIVRSALGAYVGASPELTVVGAYSDGSEAVAAVSAPGFGVDVVLMDVRMPVMDGITATEQLRAGNPNVKVLLLTSFDEDDYMMNALKAGASGFLLKDASPKAIVDAVLAVHNGTTVISPEPLGRLVRGKSAAKHRQIPQPPRKVDLSGRELDILRELCHAHSNAEIAEKLYLSESTVKTHVSAIMSKLLVNSRLKAVVRAYEWGLVDRES